MTSSDTQTNNLADDMDANAAPGSSLVVVESGEPTVEGGVGDDAASATPDRSDDPPVSESSADKRKGGSGEALTPHPTRHA